MHRLNICKRRHDGPSMILVDLSSVMGIGYHYDLKYYFDKFPIRELIKTFASLPTEYDVSERLWLEIEVRFDIDESNTMDLELIEVINCTLMEEYYQLLRRVIPFNDVEYVFNDWVEGNLASLIRLDDYLGNW